MLFEALFTGNKPKRRYTEMTINNQKNLVWISSVTFKDTEPLLVNPAFKINTKLAAARYLLSILLLYSARNPFLLK